MKIRLVVTSLVSAVLPITGFAIPFNGASGVPGNDPPITVGAGWFATPGSPPAFDWHAAGADNIQGPFTFTHGSPTTLSVTDDSLKGDQFEVFDFGSSLGVTSLVPKVGGSDSGLGPDAAFADPTYSHGTFSLAAGAHSLTLRAIGPSFFAGRGYLRIDETAQVPEYGHSSILMGIALAGLGLISFRINGQKQTT